MADYVVFDCTDDELKQMAINALRASGFDDATPQQLHVRSGPTKVFLAVQQWHGVNVNILFTCTKDGYRSVVHSSSVPHCWRPWAKVYPDATALVKSVPGAKIIAEMSESEYYRPNGEWAAKCIDEMDALIQKRRAEWIARNS